jgi:hypothetical protein
MDSLKILAFCGLMLVGWVAEGLAEALGDVGEVLCEETKQP